MKNPYLKNIGIQLWTVRNQLSEDVPGTLKAIKDAGYVQVELMRTVGSDEIVEHAHKLGLGVTSAFVEWNSVLKTDEEKFPSTDAIIEKAKEFGLEYLVFGYIGKGSRETIDHAMASAKAANEFGEKCRDAGIQLCYHNHSFEFAPLEGTKKTGWEVFVDEFDKKLVKFELDVFWAAIGGLDPIATLKQLEGRVSQVHLKDLMAGTGTIWDEGQVPHEAFKELGNGSLDMSTIISVSSDTGVDQCHVEQDQSPDPLASIVTSANYLKG